MDDLLLAEELWREMGGDEFSDNDDDEDNEEDEDDVVVEPNERPASNDDVPEDPFPTEKTSEPIVPIVADPPERRPASAMSRTSEDWYWTDDEEPYRALGMVDNLKVLDKVVMSQEEFESLPKSVRSYLTLAKMKDANGVVSGDVHVTRAELVLIETLFNKMTIKKYADDVMKWTKVNYFRDRRRMYRPPPREGENLYDDDYDIEESLSDLEVALLIYLMAKLNYPYLKYESINTAAAALYDLDQSHYAHRILRILKSKIQWVTKFPSRFGDHPPNNKVAYPWGKNADIWFNAQPMFDQLFHRPCIDLHYHTTNFLLAFRARLDPIPDDIDPLTVNAAIYAREKFYHR